MNKKAATVLMMLFEIMIVIVVISLAITYSYRLGSSDSVLRERVQDDIIQMMYAGVSTPGDFVVAYPTNLSEYNLLLSSNTIYVGNENTPARQKQGEKFILPKTYTASGVVDNQEIVCLEKQQKVFLLRSCNQEESEFYFAQQDETMTENSNQNPNSEVAS